MPDFGEYAGIECRACACALSARLVAQALPDCGPQLAAGLQLLHHRVGLHTLLKLYVLLTIKLPQLIAPQFFPCFSGKAGS